MSELNIKQKNSAFLEIENFNKSFGNTKVLKGINLTLNQGEVLSIIGSSGSGKTTLLKCINGLYDYDGHIYYDDILVDEVPTKDRNLGYVSQEFALLFRHYP